MAEAFTSMNPLAGPGNYKIKYTGVTYTKDKEGKIIENEKTEAFNIENLGETLAANGFFTKNRLQPYNYISRHGFFPIYDHEQVTREYLFFTKPDLNLFTDNAGNLNAYLASIPFFSVANDRASNALKQLQSSVTDSMGVYNPFMYLLSNRVTSKLDLPGISAESKESTSNIMGTSIQYRGHSYKSDNGHDFSLSFTDTAQLEIYTMLKAYDEYMRLLKTGEVAPKKVYIENRIISEQFSIYKFLVGEDGETILFYSKLTGCYFTDVPRGDMSDPGPDGFKYSVSFHAQFVEDSNPMILSEFNRISPGGSKKNYANTYDYKNNVVDNTWVRWPVIVPVSRENDKQVERRGTSYDYRLRWIKG